jgi:hypothetical protein
MSSANANKCSCLAHIRCCCRHFGVYGMRIKWQLHLIVFDFPLRPWPRNRPIRPMDIDPPPLPGDTATGNSFLDNLERRALAEVGIAPAPSATTSGPPISKEKQEREKRPQPRTPSPPRKRVFRKQPTFTLSIDISRKNRGIEFSVLVRSIRLFNRREGS